MNLAGRLASSRFCPQTSCKSCSSEGFDCWLPRLLTRSVTRALLGAVQAGSVVNVLPVPVWMGLWLDPRKNVPGSHLTRRLHSEPLETPCRVLFSGCSVKQHICITNMLGTKKIRPGGCWVLITIQSLFTWRRCYVWLFLKQHKPINHYIRTSYIYGKIRYHPKYFIIPLGKFVSCTWKCQQYLSSCTVTIINLHSYPMERDST